MKHPQSPDTVYAKEPSPTFDDGSAQRRHGFAAWFLSLLGNTGLLVVLSLLLVRASTDSGAGESVRDAGIVLAETTSSNQTTFLSETEEAETSETAAAPTMEFSEVIPQEPTSPSEFEPAEPTENLALPLPGTQAANRLADQLSLGPISLAGDRMGEAEFIAQEQERQRQRNQGPVGPPARMSLFGSGGAEGHRFVFVIDRSKSMGGQGLGALAAARDELYRQLQLLNENHSFQIVAYHHKTVMLSRRGLLTATQEHIDGVPEYFQGLAAFGGTDHENAIHVALRLEPDVLFFLTDGDLPELNQIQLQDIQRLCEGKTNIHCIQFGAGSADESTFMRRLAQMTNGGFHYVDMNRR